MVLRDQYLRILECLNELSWGVREKTMGVDMDHPHAVSPIMDDQAAPLLGVPWALFNALQEALVHLNPAIRWEQDPTSSEFI